MISTLKYPYIRAWGICLHSMDYYIRHEIEVAQIQNAPEKAVYRNADGSWVTLDQCVPETQAEIEMIISAYGLLK